MMLQLVQDELMIGQVVQIVLYKNQNNLDM